LTILRYYPRDVANIVASLLKTTVRRGEFSKAERAGLVDIWRRRAALAESRNSPLGSNLNTVAQMMQRQDLSELQWLYFQAGRNVYSFIVRKKSGLGTNADVILTGRGDAFFP